MKNYYGFTIIELLVVIAVIGILASVVLGSLSSAREDGLDTKIISEMAILSKRARVDESRAFTYDVVCGSNGISTSTEVSRIIASIEEFSPEPVVCNSDIEVFAVSAALESALYWCVDSVGASKSISSPLGSTEFQCP